MRLFTDCTRLNFANHKISNLNRFEAVELILLTSSVTHQNKPHSFNIGCKNYVRLRLTNPYMVQHFMELNRNHITH